MNKELKLLATLKQASSLMDEIDEFKNSIALEEIIEYIRVIQFKGLWYDIIHQKEEPYEKQ